MYRRILIPLAVLILISGLAAADPLAGRGPTVLHGGPGTTAKAEVDTVNLMSARTDPTNGSGEPAYFGDFEDFATNPSWNGWTSADLTQPEGESHWHASGFKRISGDFSAWCGDPDIPSCGVGDTLGGYGNSWNETLEWRATVPNVAEPCTVTVDAILNLDTMPGYDYGHLSVVTGDGIVTDLWADADLITGQGLHVSYVYQPWSYTGSTDDEVVIQFRVTTDGGWSNLDCLWPGDGAMQVDDVAVALSQGGVSTFDDFEDGTLGNWQALDRPGVGDYAKLWIYLEDLDLCRSNWTTQVAFIDEGTVVPGTGGTMCLDWCYGPGGYIVNNSGGLAYPPEGIHNVVESPVMDWPAGGNDGALLEFDVYHQMALDSDEPRMYYAWEVRSADTDGDGGLGVQVIEDQPWVNRGVWHFGEGTYERDSNDLSGLLVPGRDQVQVRLVLWQQWFESTLSNGNPTPYFDNVTVKAFPCTGPALSVLSANLAQDGFPQGGTLDAVDPGGASVRFDMARNIAVNDGPLGPFTIDPGDSIVVSVEPLGTGAVISPAPRLEYRLERLGDWNGMRTAGLPDAGYVAGTEVLDPLSGLPTGEWSFDLPDTGFLLPGDVLHYLVVATETGPGGTTQMFLPADTTGFHDFSNHLAYDPDFTVRALPGVTDASLKSGKTVITTGGPALFWFDAGDHAGLETWIDELDVIANDPFFSTFAYDLFVTRDPASGLGNGLGGRATAAQLANYGTLLYSSGEETMRTLGDGAPWRDISDDMGVIWDWLQDPERRYLFMTGDNLVSDLDRSGGGIQFAQEVLGVDLVDANLRPLIENQTAPRVLPMGGTGLFLETPAWVAYGGCLKVNTFDAVQARTGYLPAAEFTDPAGQPGAYSYAAAVVSEISENLVISLPYDLMFVYTDPTAMPPPPKSARQALLGDVLHAFMYMWGPIGDAPGSPAGLTAAIHPNPFNPRVTIDYTVPAPGRLSVKVYDVRGRLVRTVMDEKVLADGKTVWDGRDDRGGEAASGVYFYEVRLGGDVEIGKMALVR